MLPPGFLTPQHVSLCHPAASKKKALEAVSELLASGGGMLAPEAIYEQLLERERLGSTGLAHGIALPHARMIGLTHPTGAFLRLQQGVDYEALDDQPVDLIFALLVPDASTQEHLDLLAKLAGLFSESSLCEKVRQAEEVEQILGLLQEDATPDNRS
jgi:PTS system nitrogen regulatory IIA component